MVDGALRAAKRRLSAGKTATRTRIQLMGRLKEMEQTKSSCGDYGGIPRRVEYEIMTWPAFALARRVMKTGQAPTVPIAGSQQQLGLRDFCPKAQGIPTHRDGRA